MSLTRVQPELVNQLAKSNMPAGSVLQVQSFTKRDTYVSSGNFGDPSLDIIITPTSTSSKILVTVSLCMSTSSTTLGFKLRRNGTDICIGDAYSSATRMTVISSVGNNEWQNNMSYTFLDSPSSTSALTYDIVVGTHDGREYRINRAASPGSSPLDNSVSTSTITVMEIAG